MPTYHLHPDRRPLFTETPRVIPIPGPIRLEREDLRHLIARAIAELPRDAHVNQLLAIYLHARGEGPAPQYRAREPDNLKVFDDLRRIRGINREERTQREALLWAELHRKEDEASWTNLPYNVLLGDVGAVTSEGVNARMAARILRDEDDKSTLDENMEKAVTVFAVARPGDIFVAEPLWRRAVDTAAFFATYDKAALARASEEERAWAKVYQEELRRLSSRGSTD